MPNFTILGVSHCTLFIEIAKIWPFYGQNMVLTWSLRLVLPESQSLCQGCSMPNFTLLGLSCSPLSQKWPKYGLHCQNIVLTWPFKLVLLNLNKCAQGYSLPNFQLLGVSSSPLSLKQPKFGPFMAKAWSSHDPSNWFSLNHNHCAQGCSMLNFTILGVVIRSLFLVMAKIWPFYGQNMVLSWSFKLVLPES